jgi:hypothetical protein
MDLMDHFKESLKTLQKATRFYREKPADPNIFAYLQHVISDDIKNIDLLQSSLMNYIRINNPVVKKDTVNILIEKELNKYKGELEEKKVKVFKTLEKNLPEIAIPDDQLIYILDCLLQYLITSIPPGVSFGVFTKSVTIPGEKEGGEAPVSRKGQFIEILMLFADTQKSAVRSVPAQEIPALPKEGMLDILLKLVDEIVKRNRGALKLEVDEKKGKTTISLRFPLERRKTTFCQPDQEPSNKKPPYKTTFERLSSLGEVREKG